MTVVDFRVETVWHHYRGSVRRVSHVGSQRTAFPPTD